MDILKSCVDQIYCINLDCRTDRLVEFYSIMDQMGFSRNQIKRISAVPHPNGAVGCAMSHATVMSDALFHRYKRILVFEDDVQFREPLDTIARVIQHAVQRPDFKVLLLAYSHFDHARVDLDDKIAHLTSGKTTACYVMSDLYFERYLQLCLLGACSMIQNPSAENLENSCDMVWLHDQGVNSGFYCSTHRCALQRPSFSNVLNCFVNTGC